jgi:MFS family permease
MPHVPAGEAARLRDISPQQWKTGIAAWLGWTFDGLELHLYTLVATPVVVTLLGVASADNPAVKEKSAYIQASFLIGWAVGGAFFGRLGDILGRSRALALTVLTYALCTGLCAAAQTWWQLMIFRFVAALGIGGEWAVGASLLAETWPKAWRPWLAAVLQSGVNLGILFAAAVVWLLSQLPHPPTERMVFLLGVLPALLVFWIRRQVPEPESWRRAEASAQNKPHVRDLFRGSLARVTWCTTVACALSLSAWWLFVFWHPQHLRKLLAATGTPAAAITQQVSAAFFVMIAVSIGGNYFAGWLAQKFGNRRAIALLFWGLFASMAGAFIVPRSFGELAWFWVPLTGFFSGVFGLFTMYLPPLFPVLLRTTGAGFCYNIGRLAAAAASLVFGWAAPVGDFRMALLASSGLALAAAVWSWWLPAESETV